MSNTILLGLAIFILLDFALVAYVIYRRRKSKFSGGDAKMMVDAWARITAMTDQRHAVLEADKLLDFALTRSGYAGTLGEKLKKCGRSISNIDGVWDAHKLRNRIAHELDFTPTASEATRAIRIVERALRDLGALSK